jgi:ComF family protein
MVYICKDFILRKLFPATCLLCGAPGTENIDICTPCLQELPHNHNHCRICALPLASNHANPVCGNCLKQAPNFDCCHAPFIYGYPLSGLISDFKFNYKLYTGRLLAELLINSIEKNQLKLPELIMPVPLHSSRLRERGFNQAMELAKPIGRHFNIPIDIKSCKRARATETQSTLDKKIRIKNMRGAFKVVQKIECEHLVLIDDVVTTGTTVNELAKTIKASGVKRVDVWSLARTP